MDPNALGIANAWSNVGKQLFQGQGAYEAGRTKMAQALAKQEQMQAHADALRSQAGLNNEKTQEIQRRAAMQTPEFATKAAQAFAGFTDPQAQQVNDYYTRGSFVQDLPTGQEGPPVPVQTPSFFTPEAKSRFDMAKTAQLLGLNATGNTNGEQLADAIGKLQGQGRIDRAIVDPNYRKALGPTMAAIEGKGEFNNLGANGVFNQFSGDQQLNEVGKSAAMQNRAQAGNASASAALHRAQIPEVQARTELTRSKIGAATVNPDGSITTPSGKPVKLSATAEKELFEADDNIKATESTIGLLKQAKELNDKAYSGYFAKSRAVARSNLPGESEQANATIQLDNIMTTQALESLKATFGAAPTEGERKILLDIQASADKTPKQRAEIIDRAVKAAENRMRFNVNKAKSLRSGTYNTVDPQQRPSNDPIDDLLKKYGG